MSTMLDASDLVAARRSAFKAYTDALTVTEALLEEFEAFDAQLHTLLERVGPIRSGDETFFLEGGDSALCIVKSRPGYSVPLAAPVEVDDPPSATVWPKWTDQPLSVLAAPEGPDHSVNPVLSADAMADLYALDAEVA